MLYDGGTIDGYLNTGVLNQDSSKTSWRKLSGPFAGGVGGVPGSKVRLADIDGTSVFIFGSISIKEKTDPASKKVIRYMYICISNASAFGITSQVTDWQTT